MDTAELSPYIGTYRVWFLHYLLQRLVPVIGVVLKSLKLALLAFMKWMQIDYADSACMTNTS